MTPLKRGVSILLLLATTGCGAIHRHPTATKIVIIGGMAAIGGVVGYETRKANECPTTYDGKPYQGTPWGPYPCPQYAEGGGKR